MPQAWRDQLRRTVPDSRRLGEVGTGDGDGSDGESDGEEREPGAAAASDAKH